MKITIIRNRADLASLEREWNQLLDQSAADTIFLTWEWITSWLEVQRSDLELFVVVVRDSSKELIAVAPFYTARYRLMGCLKVSALRVLGDASSGAEYGNILIREGGEREAASQISQCLDRSKNEWDIVWIPNVAKWEAGYSVLKGVVSGCSLLHRERNRVFGSVSLPSNADDFLATMSKNRRQQLRRTCRKVFKNPDINVIQIDDADTLPQYLDILFDLHAKRRALKDDSGSFVRNPSLKEFYRSFAPKAFARGWLRMIALIEKDKVIAIQYGFRYRDTYMQLQEGFDPEGESGLGTALRKSTIDIFIAESITEYDFLGGFTEHKRRWQAVERNGCDILVCNDTMLSRLIFRSGIWPTGRYLRPA